MVESGLVPEGAFQFICGSAGDLLDHLDGQDCVAFTGSAATGRIIRGNPNLTANNVRVNIEADSINAAVLAPDVDASSETYGLFVGNVVLDMCQKAGQKCTAVRRVFVPEDRMDEVQADLIAELARYPMGEPQEKTTRLGPVAHSAQLADVQPASGGSPRPRRSSTVAPSRPARAASSRPRSCAPGTRTRTCSTSSRCSARSSR